MSAFFKICAVFLLVAGMAGDAFGAEQSLNRIAAVVNGEMITMHELRMHMNVELARRRMQQNDPKAVELQREVLDSMINDVLMRQEAKRYKVAVSDAEIEAEISRQIKRSGMPFERFEAEMSRQGMTMERYKDQLGKRMLGQRIASHMVARKVFVTPEEVETYYNNNKDEFAGEKTVDFSILMLPAKVNAQAIYKQVTSGKVAFEEVARQHSTDRSAQEGGRVAGIPWDRLPQEMQKLLSSLQDGKMSPLMRTQGGFIVIRRDRITEARPLTFQEAKPRIEEILRAPLLEERFKEFTEQLRSRAVIDIRI